MQVLVTIMAIAKKHKLFVIEDAAQGMMATYKGRPLGSIGHMAAFSFHETKNYTSGGEGGLLIINDESFVRRAEIVREKGTNRSQFFRGMVDKYTWVDVGSSYLPGELQAAYLFGQIEKAEEINSARLAVWAKYQEAFLPLANDGLIELPGLDAHCVGNGHMYYIKVDNIQQRTKILKHLSSQAIGAVFHYVPLHSAPAGMTYGRFHGQDIFTTVESERLFRLPLWLGMKNDEITQVIQAVIEAIHASRS
jgi:dTDP-4-amino-4,6-dideoxygalactose transaminase